jgi:nicotinamidase-related amidase
MQRMGRRHMMGLLAGVGWQSALAAHATRAESASQLTQRPRIIGTTFSQLQCRYLDLEVKETFRQVCQLGYDRIRLCSYWNEIEPTPGKFDFTTLDWLLDESQKYGVEIVLTVGMKAPRWPEFHFPDWVKARYPTDGSKAAIDQDPAIADLALTLIAAVMRHTRNAPHLNYWQVENEPLTRLEITAGRWLSPAFLRQEVALVRQLAVPGQKVVMTNAIDLPAGSASADEAALQISQSLADCVGINVYTKVPAWKPSFYLQPLPSYWQTLRRWQGQLSQNGKAAWIAESQAEPWEPHQLVPTKRLEHPSSSPWRASRLATFLAGMGYDTVMLWGCEYWYWQKRRGHDEWWQMMQKLAVK